MGGTGRVALVTGASRGIGLAIARRLAADGCRVCLTARTPEPLAEAVDAVRAAAPSQGGASRDDPAGGGAGPVAIGVAGKAGDPAHQAEAVQTVLDTFGRLDVLVNNAGINPVYGPLIGLEPAAVRKVFEVNVFAALDWIALAHRAWMGEHGGAIVNVASVAGLRPAPGLGAYALSKAALIHMTRQLAVELGPGIRVNAVAPAVVKTRFASKLYEHDEQGVAAGYPLGRLGEPDDVAEAVSYLAGTGAGWVTGHTLVIDGGITLTGSVS